MRKGVILLLLCMYCNVNAQRTYESVLQDGLVWKMKYGEISYPERVFNYTYRDLVLLDDTLIDEIPFNRAYYQYVSDSGELVRKPSSYHLIGQKDGVVYQHEENDRWEQKYYPIMDFSLEVGDEFSVYLEDPTDEDQRLWELKHYKVIAVKDTILDSCTDRRKRRCVHVKGFPVGEDDYWVEGVGSLKYGIKGRTEFDNGVLMQCTQANEVLYAFDEDYHPLLGYLKSWNCRLVEPVEEETIDGPVRYNQTTDYCLFLEGDSVVGENVYWKVNKRIISVKRQMVYPDYSNAITSVNVTNETTLWPELWREQGRKVYSYSNGKEHLRYDFSATAGSTVDIGEIRTGIISVDTISLSGQNLCRLHLALCPHEDTIDRVWIESVGHPNGPFCEWGAELSDGRKHFLLSCDGYTAEEYEQTDAISHIPVPQKLTTTTSALFDLQGRRVNGQPRPGIYIGAGDKHKVMKK